MFMFNLQIISFSCFKCPWCQNWNELLSLVTSLHYYTEKWKDRKFVLSCVAAFDEVFQVGEIGRYASRIVSYIAKGRSPSVMGNGLMPRARKGEERGKI